MITHLILYFVGGLLSGCINAIAGGGSLVLFPLLINVGVPAITANTTMSLVILPGSLSSAFGYRHRLAKLPRKYFLLLIPCAVGSLLGALLLLDTSNNVFMKVVPIFMLVAVTLLILQPAIHRRLYKGKRLQTHHMALIGLISLAFFTLSVYGGYFGAGFGIIAIGLLGLTPLSDIQQMTGLKNCAGIAVGAVDCSYFIHRHVVDWHVLPFLLLGSLIGGYLASTYSSKLPAAKMRAAIIVLAAGITLYLAFRFYR